MKSCLFGLVLLALTVVTTPVPCAATPADSALDLRSLISGNTKFALDLFRQLKGDGENIFFSPYGISEALGMTYAGARGVTEKQMRTALGFILEQSCFHHSFAVLRRYLQTLQQKDSIDLFVANMLWPQAGLRLNDGFLQACKQNYGVSIRSLDFAGSSEGARKTINDWVADATRQKILDLIPPGGVNPITRLVLTNAVYFKAAWCSPFSPEMTRQESFKLENGTSLPMQFMNQRSRLKYAETKSAQILQMPYSGGDFSMLVLLPKATNRLSAMEASLTSDSLRIWQTCLELCEVEVALPKFKLTQMFDLRARLSSLGIVDAFTDTADFSGITRDAILKITAVYHKAFVDVSEEGTEAAASTAVVFGGPDAISDPPRIIKFCADHPFLFLICDNTTGSILFLGRLADPSKRDKS